MSKKIKIGDTVVYSPSLAPVIGEVKGIMGDYITVKDEDGEIWTTSEKDLCPITEEELERLKQIRKGNSD